MRPMALNQERVDWLVLRQHKALCSGEHAAFPHTRPAEWQGVSQVWLLVPACDVVFRRLSFSGRKLPPLSWLVEETLAGDADQLHWRMLQRSESTVSVMGANREQLTTWLTRCSQQGLAVTRVIPDALLLPWQNDSLTLYSCRSQWWVRHAQNQALITEAAWLPQVLAHFGDTPRNITETFAQNMPELLAHLAPFARASKINLLPGLINVQVGARWLPWLKKGTLLALTLGLLLLIGLPVYQGYSWQQARLVSARGLLSIWHHYFLDEPADSNVAYWFMQRKPSAARTLTTELLALNSQLKMQPELQIQQLRFQEYPTRMELSFTNPPPEALQQFIAASQAMFAFKVDAARGTPEQVVLISQGEK